jgi:glycosyltransferase involved in cell wall biosynthesis
VIVATWWETAEWVSVLPPSKGARVHLVQHDERIFSTDPAKRQRAADTWRLPGFTRVVVAGWLRDLGRRDFGVESILVNNAVDTTLFTAPPRDRNEPPVFGLMYHARDFKGTDISLKAFELAARSIPGIRLKAFGPEPEMQHMPLPPGASLEVLPPQPRIAAFYRSCDAYLFGSRCEGFGLPILEAMACRTPVIGTPTGAAPELIAEGGGMLVRMEDSRSMADAIVRIAGMPAEQWKAMSDAAFATAQMHTWERAIAEFEAVLHAASGRRTAGEAALGLQASAQVSHEPPVAAAPV